MKQQKQGTTSKPPQQIEIVRFICGTMFGCKRIVKISKRVSVKVKVKLCETWEVRVFDQSAWPAKKGISKNLLYAVAKP